MKRDLHRVLYTLIMLILIGDSYSFFEDFSKIYRHGKQTISSIIQPRSQEENFMINLKSNKLQRQFSNNDKFFCDLRYGARSNVIPTSVHRLKPGDIDIIGAIGDSLTAANGAFATNSIQLFLEGRGVSWCIGGQGTWKKYLTLPNILKLYNPNLYGYSVNEYSNFFDKSSRFNVAVAGSHSKDSVMQAQNLVMRMRNDKKVDIKNHWKLITFSIGANDICGDVCYYDNQFQLIENAANDLIQVLRILKQHLPRTLVNVVLPPDVNLLTKIQNRPHECRTLHYLQCPCMFSPTQLYKRNKTLNTLALWKKRMAEVVKMHEFHNTDVSVI